MLQHPAEVALLRRRRCGGGSGRRALWRAKLIDPRDGGYALPTSKNGRARRFNPRRAKPAGVSDIPTIRPHRGVLDLVRVRARVLAPYARKVVGRALASTLRPALGCAAPPWAIAQRRPMPGWRVHSDRGGRYASALQQALLARPRRDGGMRGKGNGGSNAVRARLFLSRKTERVRQREPTDGAESISDIAGCNVKFDNGVRLHAKLGHLPRHAFEPPSATHLAVAGSKKT